MMGETGTAQTLLYKGKLPQPLNPDIFNNTFDEKQIYNFTGATNVHQLSQGTKRSDVYAIAVDKIS